MNAIDLCRSVRRAIHTIVPVGTLGKTVCEEDLEPVYIRTTEELECICDGFRKTGMVGVDTEFVRVRTFFPKLGLIQVSDRRNTYIIDPIELSDLSPFVSVLKDKGILKIFHSCAEDLEVLWFLCGSVPWPIFDTQVAASFLGFGYQCGYQALCKELFGAEMTKTETRSNWLKRPLTDEQIRYAAMDVAYLLPLHSLLTRKLRKLGRLGWVREEFERLIEEAATETDPEEYYLRIGSLWQHSPRDLGVLRDLFAWRERVAIHKDLPRSFIMKDKVVRALGRKKPQNMRELAEVEGVRPSEVRRFGKKLIRLIRESLDLPEETYPEAVKRPPNTRKVARLVDDLRSAVANMADEMCLPAELVARKKSVVELVQNYLQGVENPMPRDFSGWRREVVGEILLERLRKQAEGGVVASRSVSSQAQK